jgi:hypothetical protein
VPASAAFLAAVAATASFSAYTVPTPSNVRCSGLGLLRGTIHWDAVTPPSGATVSYDVTQPDGRVVNSTATSYALPAVSLIGTYTVRTRISAGNWTSAGSSRSVTNVAGIYICG